MCRAPCFADGGLTNLCRGRSLIQFELALNCVRVGPQLCVPESRHQNILAFFITYKNRKQNRFNSRESINGEFSNFLLHGISNNITRIKLKSGLVHALICVIFVFFHNEFILSSRSLINRNSIANQF